MDYSLALDYLRGLVAAYEAYNSQVAFFHAQSETLEMLIADACADFLKAYKEKNFKRAEQASGGEKVD